MFFYYECILKVKGFKRGFFFFTKSDVIYTTSLSRFDLLL